MSTQHFPIRQELATDYNWIYDNLICEYDPANRVMQFNMNTHPHPSFTPALMHDIRSFQKSVVEIGEAHKAEGLESPFDFLVLGSAIPGVYSLGGDLGFFLECIRGDKREVLESYALLCIDVLYDNHRNLNQSLRTVALMEGDALGAAFEAALSCDVIIAEKGIKIGFPEVVFNMFPGMGAYSFLSRRIAPAQVERMINTGKIYSSEELFELGVIDVLAEPGEAKVALRQFVRKHSRSAMTRNAVLAMRDEVFPLTHDELKRIVLLWVDSAMALPDRDLKMMERLVKAQAKKMSAS
ncbi:MAG TPA: enoyl-CoA hydratase [Thiolapillus brandeum]|uniref:Enoyl-CoA hydratase n=1 Tax=Thiolapillus brandeum TaxID=1076588 RepID=A0A831KA66_9GAMM|nr:enoyl-CoA hydratase [Thiolapillus brandeum]